MEFHGSHPLDNITRNNPYSMLEALIPFVDYPMKLPLALLVKYYEVRLILNAFQSRDTLSEYGLNNSSKDPMDMLGNVLGVSPEMIRTLMTIMESQNNTDSCNRQNNPFYRNADNYTENTLHHDNIADEDTTGSYINNNYYNDAEYNFDDSIGNIFAEYDMLQAAEYTDMSHTMNSQKTKGHEYYENNSEPLQSTEYNSHTDNIIENRQYNPEPEYYI